MYRNVTLRLTEEAARWLRREAAEKDMSMSRFLQEVVEREMRQRGEYLQAFEHWKALMKDLPPLKPDAQRPASREETHDRELDRRDRRS